MDCAGTALAASRTPDKDTAHYEVDFNIRMIDHHGMGMKMAAICEAKATRAELRALCTDIRTMQGTEIATMRDWLTRWYGRDHLPRLSAAQRHELEHLQSRSGTAFDIAFMEMINGHHATAMSCSSKCLVSADPPPLRSLCGMIIEAQLSEIRSMQWWLCQWYGKCRGRLD